MLALYSYTLVQRLFIPQRPDKHSTALIFVYLKHILDIIIQKMTISQYELSRSVMWSFTCPIMLKMYIDANSLTFNDINAYYFIVSIVLNVPLTFFKTKLQYYTLYSIAISIPCFIFLRKMYKYKMLPFTKMYIMLWITFITINALDLTGLINPIHTHAAFNIADTICKYICNVVISEHNEIGIHFRENMDMQGVNFVSHLLASIKKFETTNIRITSNCGNLIKYCKNSWWIKFRKRIVD